MKIIADNEEQARYIRDRLDRIVRNMKRFYRNKQTYIDDGCFLTGVINAVKVDYGSRSEDPCPYRVNGACTEE